MGNHYPSDTNLVGEPKERDARETKGDEPGSVVVAGTVGKVKVGGGLVDTVGAEVGWARLAVREME